MVGVDLQSYHCGIVRRRARCTLFQPETDQVKGRRVGFKPLPAAMRHGQSGLDQQQALLGGKRRDPPPLGTLDNGRVIRLGLEPQKRELESSLAVLAAVAGSLITAEPGQQRHDLVAEADSPLRLGIFDRDLDPRLGRAEPDPHLGRSVGDRANPPLAIHPSDFRV